MLARAGEGIAKGRQGGILPVSTARYEAALLPRPVESTCPPVATALVRPLFALEGVAASGSAEPAPHTGPSQPHHWKDSLGGNCAFSFP